MRFGAQNGAGTEVATSSNVPSFAPEVTAEGLVLWRLGRDRARQLRCEVKELAQTLLVRVHNPVTSRTVISESYGSVRMAVDRAFYLRDQYIASGWTVIDTESADASGGPA